MNILYLAHRIPFPPDKGDKIRSFQTIRHLARSHRVWCACFIDDRADVQHVAGLRRYCQDIVAIPLCAAAAKVRGLIDLMRGGTITEGFYRCSQMRRALEDWSRHIRFDAVLAFSSSMAAYAKDVPASRRVLDLCDLDSMKWLDYSTRSTFPFSWMYGLEGRRLGTLERRMAREFDATVLITTREATGLRGHVPLDRVHVVTNGVALAERTASECQRPTVGFVGVMDYHPNVDAVRWFVNSCWREIRRQVPGAIFRIVGSDPVRAVRRLSREPGVIVVGPVNRIIDELPEFHVSVAPLRIARGLQNKVLEAMAAGVPVVGTSAVAAGLDAGPGRDLLVADTPDQIVDATVNLLRDPALRVRIGAGGRRYAARAHRWDDALDRIEFLLTGQVERTLPSSWVMPPVSHAPSEVSASRTLEGAYHNR